MTETPLQLLAHQPMAYRPSDKEARDIGTVVIWGAARHVGIDLDVNTVAVEIVEHAEVDRDDVVLRITAQVVGRL